MHHLIIQIDPGSNRIGIVGGLSDDLAQRIDDSTLPESKRSDKITAAFISPEILNQTAVITAGKDRQSRAFFKTNRHFLIKIQIPADQRDDFTDIRPENARFPGNPPGSDFRNSDKTFVIYIKNSIVVDKLFAFLVANNDIS